MTYVIAPDFRIKQIEWSLDRPAQVNRSEWTGKRTVVANPWHGKWRARAELAAVQGEAGVRALRAFLVNLKGAINSFRLYATIELQNANTGVTVSSTAASGASTMAITGYTTAMKAGQYMTVKGQLVCCTADQSGSTVYFQPPLRQSASAGTTVVTSRPYALVCLTDSRVGWAIGNARMHSISIDVEEAILETDATAPEGEAP